MIACKEFWDFFISAFTFIASYVEGIAAGLLLKNAIWESTLEVVTLTVRSYNSPLPRIFHYRTKLLLVFFRNNERNNIGRSPCD
jgi:hypothetical protein